MAKNIVETPRAQTPAQIGISYIKSGGLIDRRTSVAPMLDWTDYPQTGCAINQ
jgi:hypothetical protein